MKSKRGFSLIEMLIYVSMAVVVGGLLTGILSKSTEVMGRGNANSEVSRQLSVVMGTIQQMVSSASLVESVYKTNTNVNVTSSTTPNVDLQLQQINDSNNCDSNEKYCTLKLRFEEDNVDPTWIVATSTGVYFIRGDNGESDGFIDNAAWSTLTTDLVTTDFLRFTKYEFAGGHASVQADLSLTYKTNNPKFKITRTLTSAVGKVTAAVFDDAIVPNTPNIHNVGQSGNKWKNGYFSGNLIAGGTISIATTTESASNPLFVDGSSQDVIITPEGHLGIGVTPDGPLQVISSNDPPVMFRREYAASSSTRTVLALHRQNSGGPGASGIGLAIVGYVETTASSTNQSAGQIAMVANDATVNAINSEILIKPFYGGSVINNALVVRGTSTGAFIGINTTNPTKALHVTGAIMADEIWSGDSGGIQGTTTSCTGTTTIVVKDGLITNCY